MKVSTKRFLKEFHVSRRCREVFGLETALFSSTGNLIVPDFHTVRELVHRIRSHPESSGFPEGALKAGQVNAMGLIDEILHYVVHLFCEQVKADVMAEAVSRIEAALGTSNLHQCLIHFSREFPPARFPMDEEEYYHEMGGNSFLRQAVLEEILMLWLANANPAFSPYRLLFADDSLRQDTCYLEAMQELHSFFKTQPPFGPDSQNLIDMLRSPALAVPHSLSGQIDYIRRRWGFMLQPFFSRLLISLDLMREEEKAVFHVGPGPQEVADFSAEAEMGESFSADAEWMVRLVLLAKSVHVWLDQLSQKHGRPIRTLDQIPDEELDIISGWGFSGLWLIGLWERSRASKTIKRLCGNPEALASAYSIFAYRIEEELGGEHAFLDLKARAGQRGIRLAADMVPNHMGIDSPWVAEHPDWFVQVGHSPFPAYRFSGPDLSADSRVAILLEDHYYNRRDAAVVFKRVDLGSGGERFIYHGNDGTRMPWNDTAQLNYLLPQVREEVIQSILRVARLFPIIRFDAAMTLTKRHYQRLWFPIPGSGGDIPSRAGQGMDKAAFDKLMPQEFWREVVDRIAAEAKDTLLLAEAFWLLEGYFVRTLGMHRVYNSAFMNFLKNEENDRFRSMLKNILEFQPEILARFVNFMNNPDEETAVAQFGKGDKYFGVCTLMATLPGLPMFGHGQIEGLQEKYGMEYRRSYWQERPDMDLIRRHEQEIFPLLRRRHLFSGVAGFELFDFSGGDGAVNENVIAFCNRLAGEKALVVYNNAYERTAGRIFRAAPVRRRKDDGGSERMQCTVADALEMGDDKSRYLVMRDVRSQLEFLISTEDLRQSGIYLELQGFQSLVFLEFREIAENEWGHCRKLAARLCGRGVPSISTELEKIAREPLRQVLQSFFNSSFFRSVHQVLVQGPEAWEQAAAQGWQDGLINLFQTVKEYARGHGEAVAVWLRASAAFKALAQILSIKRLPRSRWGDSAFGFSACFRQYLLNSSYGIHVVVAWIICRSLVRMAARPDGDSGFLFLKDYGIFSDVENLFREMGCTQEKAQQARILVEVMLERGRDFSHMLASGERTQAFFTDLFSGPGRGFLFSPHVEDEMPVIAPEAFHLLLVLFAVVHQLEGRGASRSRYFPILDGIVSLAQRAGYRPELMLQMMRTRRNRNVFHRKRTRSAK